MLKYRMADVLDLVKAEATQQGVNPLLAQAIVIAENSADGRYDPNRILDLQTRSPAGAVGVGQIMPATLEGLKRLRYLPDDIDYNTLEGQVKALVAAIREKQDLYKSSDPDRIAIGYNASVAANRRYERDGVLPGQTAQYRQKVATAMNFLEMNDPNAQQPGGVVQPTVGGAASTRTSTSVSRKVIPTDINAMLMEALNEHRAGQLASSGVFAQLSSAVSENEQVVKEAWEKLFGATKTKAEATTAINRAENRQKEQNINFFGLNTEDPSAQIVRDRAREIQADEILRQLQPEVDKINALNPLTDPVGWFVGQIRKTQIAQQWNAAARQKDIAVANQASIQARAAAQAALVPQVAQSERDRIIESELTQAAATMQLELAKHQDKTFSSRLALLTNEMALRGQRFDQVFKVATLLSEREAKNELNGVSFKPGEEREFNLTNLGLKALGMRPIEEIAEFRRLDGKRVTELMKIGASVSDSGQLANTPADTLVILENMGALASLENANPGMGAFAREYMALVREAAQKPVDPLDPRAKMKPGSEERYRYEAAKLAQTWHTELGKTTRDAMSPSNPHRMRAGIFASAPGLENNPIAKEVTRKLAEENHEMNDKEVIDFAKSLIVSKTVSAQKVTELLMDFYQKGLHHQNGMIGLQSFGFSVTDPNSKKKALSYRLSADAFHKKDNFVANFFDSAVGGIRKFAGIVDPEEIDMYNPAAVYRELVISSARIIADQKPDFKNIIRMERPQ
jgi:hypothetical protein